MKKSIIAAAFAAALPLSALAQDIENQQQPLEEPDFICAQISATEHFCVALQNGAAPIMEIKTPNGIILGTPGIKYDSEGEAEQCLGIVDQNFNLLDVICKDEPQDSPPANLPSIEPKFDM